MHFPSPLREKVLHLVAEASEHIRYGLEVTVILAVEFGLYTVAHAFRALPIMSAAERILEFAFVSTLIPACLTPTLVSVGKLARVVQASLGSTRYAPSLATLAVLTLTLIVIRYQAPSTTSTGMNTASIPTFDLTLVRGAAVRSLVVRPASDTLFLSFFVPTCRQCRYIAILDDLLGQDLTPQDEYGTFRLLCRREHLVRGVHQLRVIRLDPTTTTSANVFPYMFEIREPQ
jgi:hypothetical protein